MLKPFFEGDTDKETMAVQLCHKQEFVDKLLSDCLGHLRNAEDLVGESSTKIRWFGQPINLVHFDPIFEIIAAGFRYEQNFQQLDILDGEKCADHQIFYQWNSWFRQFISEHLDSHLIQDLLLLAEASSKTLKYGAINIEDSRVTHLQSAAVDTIYEYALRSKNIIFSV